jgi:hypothetical protein
MTEIDGFWGEGYFGEGYWGEGYWGKNGAPPTAPYIGRPSAGLRLVWRQKRKPMLEDPEILKLIIEVLEFA